MEVPHNAVLLLCSSYNIGCCPYICATSHRFSNCFKQYKKACTKSASVQSLQPATNSSVFLTADEPKESAEVPELLCPFCRKQVKGWTVVKPAWKYLKTKKRTCMQDGCSSVGTYKQLREHVKSEHPCARPREVGPIQEEKWKRLEGESERNDVISTVLSSMPGAVVLADFVLEPNDHDFYNDDYDSDLDYLGDDLIPVRGTGLRRMAYLFRNFRYNQGTAYNPVNLDNVGLHRRAGRGYAPTASLASRTGRAPTGGPRVSLLHPAWSRGEPRYRAMLE